MNNDAIISYLAEWLEACRNGKHRVFCALRLRWCSSGVRCAVCLLSDTNRDVPVYGVITKLDTQESLSSQSCLERPELERHIVVFFPANSPIKKVLMNQLDKNHILNGLRTSPDCSFLRCRLSKVPCPCVFSGVRKWIPVISSPEVLNEPDKAKAAQMEADLVQR
jgi:hypothetical protein